MFGKQRYFSTSMFLRKTSIYTDIFESMFFFSFFQNISYVKNAFENQFPPLKRNKSLYRFSHFLKNIKNAFKNQLPRVKLKIKIGTGFYSFWKIKYAIYFRKMYVQITLIIFLFTNFEKKIIYCNKNKKWKWVTFS